MSLTVGSAELSHIAGSMKRSGRLQSLSGLIVSKLQTCNTSKILWADVEDGFLQHTKN